MKRVGNDAVGTEDSLILTTILTTETSGGVPGAQTPAAALRKRILTCSHEGCADFFWHACAFIHTPVPVNTGMGPPNSFPHLSTSECDIQPCLCLAVCAIMAEPEGVFESGLASRNFFVFKILTSKLFAVKILPYPSCETRARQGIQQGWGRGGRL